MKIFYSKHDEKIPYFNIPYLIPVQSGTANSDRKFDIQYHDNDGSDNISEKNDYFAELSVQYFIYKNLEFDDNEIIGLFQEKRMLLDNYLINTQESVNFINAPGNPTKFIRYNINKEKINDIKYLILKDNYDFSYYDFITRHTTFYLPLIPVKDYFCINNDSRILNFAIEAIYKYYPDYILPLNDMLNYTNLNLMDNVFVTKWKNFKAYSKWLFDILLHVDKQMMKVDPNFEVTKQIRKNLYEKKVVGSLSYKTYAWLAEHLFIVWILKNRMIRIEKWIGEFYFK